MYEEIQSGLENYKNHSLGFITIWETVMLIVFTGLINLL